MTYDFQWEAGYFYYARPTTKAIWQQRRKEEDRKGLLHGLKTAAVFVVLLTLFCGAMAPEVQPWKHQHPVLTLWTLLVAFGLIGYGMHCCMVGMANSHRSQALEPASVRKRQEAGWSASPASSAYLTACAATEVPLLNADVERLNALVLNEAYPFHMERS